MRRFSAEERALLAAIHAAPQDDFPRLVYADWLEENGQKCWARLIRTSLTAEPTLETPHHLRLWAEPLTSMFHFLYLSRGLPVAQRSAAGITHNEMQAKLHRVSPRLRFCFHVWNDDLRMLKHPVMDRTSILFLRGTFDDECGPDSADAICALADSGIVRRLDQVVSDPMTDEARELCRRLIEPRTRVRFET